MELRSQRENLLSSLGPVPDDEPLVRRKRENMAHGIDPASLDVGSTVVAANYTSQLDSLPVELLHLIFSYLSTCDKVSLRMVCRRLRFALDDPDHWRCVIIPPHISSKNHKYVKSVLKHTKSHVQSLSLVGYSSTTSSYLTSCTALTALDLYGSRITNSAMKQLLLRLPNLSRLSINDRAAQALLPMLSALQQLVITMHSWHYNTNPCIFLLEISPAKPSNIAIKYINYPGDYNILQFRSYRFGNLSKYKLSTLNMLKAVSTPFFISNSTELMRFHIPGIPDANNKPPSIIVSTAVSSSVLSANINYTHAFIADPYLSYHVSTTISPSFENIATNITSLDLKGITLHALDDVRNIVKFTPNLLIISVNGIQLSSNDPLDVLFKALSVYCPKLTSIFAIIFANRIRENEQCYVENACEVWSNIISLKHLQHLSVCSCLFQESPAPSDHHLYPNLKLLPISFQSLILNIHQTKCVQVANLDTIIANICEIQHLQMLHLYIDSFLQQDKPREPLVLNLQILLESCTKLEELFVHSYGNVFVYSSPAISQLKSLKLMIDSVPESFFTDLVPIGQKNMNLHVFLLRIYAGNCHLNHMHDSDMIRILEHCPSLVSFGAPWRPGSVFEEVPVQDVAKKYKLSKFHYGYTTCSHGMSILNNIEFSVLKML